MLVETIIYIYNNISIRMINKLKLFYYININYYQKKLT